MKNKVARGKPADYGQFILKRRSRLTQNCVSLEGKTILDFGCGNGAQTIEFANLNAQIIALDIDEVDLNHLSEYLRDSDIENIKAVKYDGTTIPLEDNSVDIVLSYEVLEHVGDEALALSEIHRVLKDDGEIVFSVPNKWWIFETHGAYLPYLKWNRVPLFSWLPRFIHQRYAKARIYTKADIRKILLQSHFIVNNLYYITAPMDVVKNRFLKNILRRFVFLNDVTKLPFLATAILVHAKKKNLQ